MEPRIQSDIIKCLKFLILDLAPDTAFRELYGGIVFETVAGNPKTRLGGIFSYQPHIALEFTYGATLKDPNSILEGKGKLRRHVKLRTLEDIENKACRDFILDALSSR